MELILNLIYIYISVFTLYYFVLALASFFESKMLMSDAHNSDLNKQKLCVVIYSQNNHAALKTMLSKLKTQNYGAENFFTYVILDNCSDHSEELIQGDSSVKILNLNDGVNVGHGASISILMENLRTEEDIDAYVFLDVNYCIEENFLQTVNRAMYNSDVVSGMTVIIDNPNMTKVEKIKSVYIKYQERFIKKARALLKLSDTISPSLLAIKKSLVDSLDGISFDDINSRLKYSILLSKIGKSCHYDSSVKAYVKLYNYNFEKPSLSKRVSLFKNCVSSLFTKNIQYIEQVLGLIAPNCLVVVPFSIFYVWFSCRYYFMFNFSVVFLIFSVLLLAFALSILKSEIFAKEFLYLLGYPFVSLTHVLDNLPPYRVIKKLYGMTRVVKKKRNKYSVQVLATDGRNNIPCRLDLISESGLAKVVFRFKNKKFETGKHIRMIEAINELNSKLKDYGFDLKICQCCEYFSSYVDGSQNMVKGFCNFQFKDRQPNQELQTLIWNSCSMCSVKKAHSLIEELSE